MVNWLIFEFKCFFTNRSGGTQTSCMDLSSGPRTSTLTANEAQDFSMPFKTKPAQNVSQSSLTTPPKSKLDDMLNKLMQKKNCVRTSRVSSYYIICLLITYKEKILIYFFL